MVDKGNCPEETQKGNVPENSLKMHYKRNFPEDGHCRQ